MAGQQLPQPQQPITDNRGQVTRPWYAWMISVQQWLGPIPGVLSASTLFGRGSLSAGAPQPITLGTGLLMTGTVLSSTGSGGTVTHTGPLTAGKAVIGNGAADIIVSGATGVAHLASGALTGSNVVLTSEVTGTLPATNGGTGLASYTKGDLLAATGAAALAARAVGANGTVLTADSSQTTGMQWSAIPSVSSWIPLVDGSEPPALITDGAGVLILVAYP